MSYGMQLFNDKGRLALSTEYKHFKFIKKVSIAAYQTWADTVKTDYSESALVAFTSATFGVHRFSTVRFSISGAVPPEGAGIYIYSDVDATAYIFDLVTNISSIGYGLRVYNKGGELIFDSDGRYLQVLDTYSANSLPYGSVPFVSDFGADVTIPYPTVVNLAVIPVSPHYHVELSNSYDNGIEEEVEEWYGLPAYKVSGKSFNVRMSYGFSYRQGRKGFTGRSVKTGTCYCILVDVGNY